MASPSSPGSPSSAHVTPPSSPLMAATDDSRRLQFSLKIAHKLDEKNFHLWRQQVEPYINAHSLTDLVVCTRIPPQFVDDEARRKGTVNPAYSIWLQKDQLLLSWLQSTLSSEILSRVLGCSHSHQLWDRLFTYFQKQTRARARQLRVELRALTLDSQSVSDYLLKIRMIVDALASIGDPIPSSHHIDVILEGLPSEYASVVSVVESKFGDMDLDEVEILLTAHELRLNKFKKSTVPDLGSLNLTHTAPQSTSPEAPQSGSTDSPNPQVPPSYVEPEYSSFRGGRSNRGGRGKGRGGRNSNVQCQVCSKVGHSALNCWHRFNQQFQPTVHPSNPYTATPWLVPPVPYGQFPANVWTRPQAPQPRSSSAYPSPSTFIANTAPSTSAASWYPDSGASYHVTNDANNLQQVTPFEGHEQIYIGNGQGLVINSAGSSQFLSQNHPHTPLTLNNLLHVPSITKNLISVSQFCRDNRVYFLFTADTCFVKCQVSNAVLLAGKVGSDGLYEFPSLLNVSKSAMSLDSSNKIVPSVNSVSISPSLSNVWHLRLGHPNVNTLRLVLQNCNLSFSNKTHEFFCSACCMGKAHRLHSPSSHTTYNHPLELVYCDLWGPSPQPSTQGFTYYISFVDAFSKFTWLYLLKSKAEALGVFKQFKSLVELQLGFSIKAVQTDWGGEFRPFNKFLTDLGIVHRVICPHTHHQNGVVERKHRHIVDLGLTLLSQASLPLTYWDYAFPTAVFLINRLPSAAIQFQVPYSMLFHTTPDYKFLRVFGCACFPLLRPYHSHKLDFRSQECLFLGYSTSHKGYKCLSPCGKLYISKDVLFNESRFPYVELFSPPSPPTSSGNSPATQHCASSLESLFSTVSLPKPVPLTAVPFSPAVDISPASTTSPRQSVSSPESTPAPAVSPLPLTPPSLPTNAVPINSKPVNQHPMQTRAKSGFIQPRQHFTLLLTHTEPKSVKQALTDDNWKAAMQSEFDALCKNNTWSLVPLPPNRQSIGCKWVFRIKENPDGSISRYKARLVAKGFHQKQGFDFNETFSPVVKPVTIRLILTMALTHKWSIQQLDVNNAFLNGLLHEEVYMDQPPGFITSDSSLVCRLHKALYGLKQAPRQWFERLQAALLKLQFKPSKCDPSLFIFASHGSTVYLLVYVDDIIITSNNTTLLTSIINKLNSDFSLKHLGNLDYFLGIEVKPSAQGSMFLTQTKYVRDLLQRTNMAGSSSVTTPMQSSCKLTKLGSPALADPYMYRSVVGALQYATITRPDIAYAVNKVCQFMSHPLESHWVAVKRILRYLQGTIQYGLHLSPYTSSSPPSLQVFCDADWASDPDDRRSTSGAAIYFGGNLVSWWSKKQPVVARSSTEAEYRSLAQATADLLWLQTLLSELCVSTQQPLVLCDNQSAVMLAHNPIMHSRTKHMEIDLFFVREKVIAKQIRVAHIPGVDQIADALTKPLSSTKFLELRHKLRVANSSSP